MNDRGSRTEGPPGPGSAEDRLDSWKRIAGYLKRDVTTVQRWERREAMPVHRHRHEKLGSVYAFRSEIDAWWANRGRQIAASEAGESVAAVPESLAVDNAPRAEGPAQRRRWSDRRLLLGSVIGLVLIAAVFVWYAYQAGYFWRDPMAEAKFSRLTDFGGTEQAAGISRDGRFAAFQANRDGKLDVWLTEIGTNQYRNLTEGQVRDMANLQLRTVAFSPDASLVTVWTRSSDGSRPEDIKIMSVPVAGGPVKLYLADAAEYDWSKDAKRLVYHTTAPGDPLYVQAAGEASAHRIYVAPPGVHCHFPIWSPDGDFIYFVRGQPPGDWDMWRLRPSGEGLERMTFHKSRVSFPVLLDARTLMYLAADADGSGPWLYVMDVPLKRTKRVSVGLERYTSLAAGASGARLVATLANTRSDLWSVTVNSGGAPQNTAVPLEPASQGGSAPRFGSDYIAYVSTGGGRRGIWKLANGKVSKLWDDTGADRVGAPSIAPDGRSIAFTVERHGAKQLYVIDSDGGHARVIASALALSGDPAWAPDSQSIVSAIVNDGEPNLARIFLDGSVPQPLLSEYSLDPVWSPDGKYFVYSGADVGTTFPLRASGPDGRPYGIPSMMLTRGARRVAFSRTSGSLVILRGEMRHKNFWLLDLQSGAARQLTDLPSNFEIGEFDVSPDGTQIIFDRVQDSSSIALIERKL